MAGRPVLFPSNVCPAVLAAVAAASADPVPVPVSPVSGLAASSTFIQAIARASASGAVMPTHLYGLWSPYDSLRDKGWFVLENDTLCVAAVRDGSRKAVGDALLVSFNHLKTIDAGVGGAVLTDDRAFADELTRIARSWPGLSRQDLAVEDNLMLARRHLRSLGRGELGEHLFDLDVGSAPRSLPDDFRHMVAEALDIFPQVVANRWKRLEMWDAALASLSEELVSPEAELVVPWRLTLRVRRTELRDALVARLRAAGFDAGTNYPPLARDFPSMLPGQDDAERWGNSVLNLWLTDVYDEARIRAAAAVISDFFETAAK